MPVPVVACSDAWIVGVGATVRGVDNFTNRGLGAAPVGGGSRFGRSVAGSSFDSIAGVAKAWILDFDAVETAGSSRNGSSEDDSYCDTASLEETTLPPPARRVVPSFRPQRDSAAAACSYPVSVARIRKQTTGWSSRGGFT